MNKLFTKGIINILLFVIVYGPLAFYLTYTSTDSIVISLIAIVVAYFLWRRIFSIGAKKQKKYADILISEKFPISQDNPLTDSKKLFSDSWIRGIGYTNDVSQPMFSKTNEDGVAIHYMCRASKDPFIIPWDRLSQISILNTFDKKSEKLARLYIPGLGMKIIVPWIHEFDQFVPERLAFDKEKADVIEGSMT